MSSKQMNKRGKRGAKNRQNNSNSSSMRSVIPHPPQIKHYEIRHSTRLRFISTGAIQLAVTWQNLLDTLLIAASATALYDAFYAVKVRAISVWSMPAIGTANTVSVTFEGTSAGSVGDQSVYTDTSMGVEPAFVRAVPTARSLASNYQLSTANSAFLLVCPTGSVVDCELSFLDAFGQAVLAQNVGVGATVGATYLRGLDGLATATSALVPALKVYQQ